ncbi:MAG: phospholipase C, phosphocholine-specific [Polyangiaceae bacterium]|nr:phospholipase C, phosphocholine-specific [Polyangiaceae bacterium]
MASKSRRHFLQLAATTAATAAFPASIRRALAIPANNATGTIRDVEHVVILTQENRSFDMYFGTLRGVRGFGDRFPIPLAGGLDVWRQTYALGLFPRVILPYHLDASVGSAQRVKGTPHGYADAQAAWNLGRMAQWPTSKEPQSMGYYRRAELDVQFALAEAFTICDAYHCSFHGGTNPNRLFLWTGTNDPTGAGGGPVIDNARDRLGPSTEGYQWVTYPERLEAAGVTWKVYQNLPDNFTDNPLAGFVRYREANEARGNAPDGAPHPPYAPGDDGANPLLKGIANTMPDGGFLKALRDDIAAGRLPQVSWIVAPASYSEHPGPSSPVQGAWYVQELLDALTADPAVWSKTVLFVNFDENDGFFDHVPPPGAPALEGGVPAGGSTVDTAGEYHLDGRPYGPGPRVPLFVISPWSRGGWVDSQVFDHTSIVRFLETRFGVREDNISAYRRAVCGDLTSAFDFVDPNGGALPALPRRDKETADELRLAQELTPQVPLPAVSDQRVPAQELGTRPSRALPYELHVAGREDAAGRAAALTFSNTGTATAVFHVYDRRHLDRAPRRYIVEPGKQLVGAWNVFTDDEGKYDLWVLGPNGFHRHFCGDVAALNAPLVAAPEVKICFDRANLDLYLTMRNTGAAPCTFTVTANAYRDDGPWAFTVLAGAELAQNWPIGRQGNWYDLTATTAQGGFSRRFAGRFETGAHGISDPAMGQVGLGWLNLV